MPTKQWGVIYSPKKNSFRTHRRWKKILHYLNEKGVDFDYVQSEKPESVERLAAMMTRTGYSTIIVVGGDAALNYALCGIMQTPSPTGKHPTLGIIPNGYVNDFAKYWEMNADNYKANIEAICRYQTRKIDVGTIDILHNNSKNKECLYFLNCINIGIAASITKLRRNTKRVLGFRTISYLFSALLLLFQRTSFKLYFKLSGEEVHANAMGICIGSAHGYGQTPSAVPYNGLLDITQVSKPAVFQIFQGLWLLFTKRFLSHRGIKVWRTNSVSFSTISNAPLSIDGRIIDTPTNQLYISIIPEEIDFIIP